MAISLSLKEHKMKTTVESNLLFKQKIIITHEYNVMRLNNVPKLNKTLSR